MMADWGIKVSKDGFNVGTADTIDLVYTSANNTGMVRSSGTLGITSSTTASVAGTATHNLGYLPGVLAFTYDGTNSFNIPTDNFSGLGVTAPWNMSWGTSTITFTVGIDSSVKTYTIRYYLLVQQLQ